MSSGRQVGHERSWLSGRGHERPLLPAMALAATVIWVYIALRAADVAFTADESISYGLFHGLTGASTTANNQWLNTLLMHAGQVLFGQAEWALRLPNVLSFGIYAGACLIIIAQFRSTAARLIAFALLLTDPFVLEFFGLARGYGLSLAFTAAALAVLLTSPRASSARRAVVHLSVAAALGVIAFYANFSAVTFVAALVLTALADVAFGARQRRLEVGRRDWIAIAVVLCATVAAMVPGIVEIRRLQNTGELYYGGHTGFVHDTIGTLAQTWGYIYTYAAPLRSWVAPVAWIAVAVGAVAIAGAAVSLARERQWAGWQLSALVVVITVAAVLVGHAATGTLYPLDRTALDLVLGFGALAGFAIDALAEVLAPGAARLALSATCALLLAFAVGNAVSTVNTTSALTWQFDASSHDAVNRLVALERTLAPSALPIELVAPFPREFAFQYYQQRLRLRWLQIYPGPVSTPGAGAYDVARSDIPTVAPGTVVVATLPEDGTELRAALTLLAHRRSLGG